MQQQTTSSKRVKKKRSSPMRWLLRLVILFVAVVVMTTAVLVGVGRWQQSQQIAVGLAVSENSDLNPVERLYLQNYLSENAAALQQAAGSRTEAVLFVVEPGETADTIATQLVAADLLTDAELFLNYTRYYGLDSQLEAGEFTLQPGMTVPELAVRLTKAVIENVEIGFLEGWRIEEMAHYLAVTRPAQVDAERFLAIAQRRTAFDLRPYGFLASLPPEATLEGFLFPDSYVIPVEADADYLIGLMLEKFVMQITPAMRQAYGQQGLSLSEAVTLASIVEREAVVAEERPIIAGVFYNRLNQGMLLQADPTVQYAVGYDALLDSWWKSPLSVADLEVVSPYNTYLVNGLPPGPIANPSLGSLVAVANPTATDYLFFVAGCGSTAGTHRFGVTYEDHLANIQSCQ